MLPDPRKLAISEHQRWLGYLQPEGLVVSSLALVDSQVQLDTGGYAAVQARLIDSLSTDPSSGRQVITNFAFFAREFLGWKDELLSIFSVAAEVPDVLRVSTGEHGEILQPDAAYKFFHPADPSKPWLLLVRQLETGASLDEIPDGKKEHGWVATPHQKFERLLRETKVPIGILCNGHSIRFTYAPKGENSGSITFPVAFMTEIAGRTVASALDLLLSHRRLITVPEGLRLPALLRKSRDYQANVSTALSGQVLESLYELARGFQAADEKAQGTLLAPVWQRDPQEIYGGLISTLLRLVFLLYAEDRSLMPSGELYQRNYSVQGLFEQLRTDHERYPDTMDDRYAGWPRLLALFRAVHGGCRHRSMTLPARRGHLFDPDRFPFLEGSRSVGVSPTFSTAKGGVGGPPALSSSIPNHLSSIPDLSASIHDPLSSIHNPQSTIHDLSSPISLPRVSDGTLFRVLDLLLYLDGERLSYRTLDVEQIGSVYETIMGFEVQKATGRCVALKPKKSHGAPVHLDLDALLAAKPAEREKVLADEADTKLPDAATKALKAAATLDDLLAVLDKRIDRRATPHPVPAGSIILQPNDERRRSGTHYTERSFTEPIVRKTLEPILDRLGRHPRPQVILALKICDIAIGSGAFQVETCRQLADELVASWHFHKCVPPIPPDEDEVLVARRLVAQGCLYGVDRNPMAVDLAKLSLWLVTMAKDHPFTFLDHAIKCGDSLVGLTNRQIADFHWLDRERLKRELDAAVTAKDPQEIKRIKADLAILETPVIGQERLEQQIAKVAAERKRILDWTEDTEAAVLKKRDFLAAADAAAVSLKTIGDLVIAAFFAGENPKKRQQFRDEFLHRHLELQKGENIAENIPWQLHTLNHLRGIASPPSSSSHPKSNIVTPIRPFHWEIEFPEVFSRENPGFDAIVGNPPFAGVVTLSESNRAGYTDFLRFAAPNTGGKCDLVAFFFRHAWNILQRNGSFGLIATKTIAQGDTRRSGLTEIIKAGGTIYYAERRREWPGQAAVFISVVILAKFPVADRILDRKSVRNINAFLLDSEIEEEPKPLATNTKRAMLGCKPGNKWHVVGPSVKGNISEETVQAILSSHPNEAAALRPYVGGADLYEMPTCMPNREIISLGLMDKQQVERYPGFLKLLAEHAGNAAIKSENWWQYSRRAVDLFERLPSFDKVLVRAEVSDTFAFAFCDAKCIFSNKAIVFLYRSFSTFGILQSSLHEVWSRLTSSTQGEGLSYVPAYSLDTFPFPPNEETDVGAFRIPLIC